MTYLKSDFYKYIAPHVAGVSMPSVEDTVEDTILDFCKKTSVYRQWLENQITVYVDDEEVEMDVPRNTAIVEVMAIQKVDTDGSYGDFVDPLTYNYSNQDGLEKILFIDQSYENYDARVRVALRPVVGFSTVPDWLYEDWRDVIVSGALSRLLAMSARAWYARVESIQHYQEYKAGVLKASQQALFDEVHKIGKPASRYI